MTFEDSVVMVRRILKSRETASGRYDAIRFLRKIGVSFKTARTMVDEIVADVPWYRQKCYQVP